MDTSDIVPLAYLLIIVASSSLLSLASRSLRFVDARATAQRAEQGHVTARITLHLLQDLDRVTMSLSVLRLALNALAVTLLIVHFTEDRTLQPWPLAGGLLALLSALMALRFGARVLARHRADAVTRWAAPGVVVASTLLGPLVAFLHRRARALAPSGGEGTQAGAAATGTGSILIPMDEALNPPDEQEMGMIRAILRMEESTVRDVMVPRPDVAAVSVQEPLASAAAVLAEAGHSRILVYDGTINQIVGTLHARDVLRLIGPEPRPTDLRELLRPALFVPENKRLDELLQEFQRERVHIAVVVDEYGETAGLVTLEDLLEEIVGEIVDEFERAEPEVQVIGPDEVVLDARVNMDFLKEHFSVEVIGEGFDTVGGLVYARLGKMPSPGDEVAVDGLKVQVLSTLGRRIKKVRILRRQLTQKTTDAP